jgi:uncharacterized pyridoxamine 5'-phosphate oxidase family protein
MTYKKVIEELKNGSEIRFITGNKNGYWLHPASGGSEKLNCTLVKNILAKNICKFETIYNVGKLEFGKLIIK